jgi:hypothetical protein
MGLLRVGVRKLFDFRDPQVWRFRALCLWGLLALVASVKAYTAPGRHSVYLNFPVAARHWWADSKLYGVYEGFETFRYSPTFAVAASPFGWMSDRLGGAVWVLASVGILLWSLRALRREVLPGEWPPGREAAWLALTWVGSAGGIWSAQSNAFILALILFGLAALQQGRWWRAAWLLAAPVYIKIWPLAICLLLLVRWFRPLAGRLTVTLLALAAVPFCTRLWSVVCQQYYDWYVVLVGPLQGRWGGYRDAWTIWEELWPPVDQRLYLVLQLTTALAVFGWCLWQSRRAWTDRSLLVLVLGVWSGWQLLLGPGTERLTYGLIAPVLAWAVLVSFRERRYRVLSLAAWGLTSLLSMGEFERALAQLVPHASCWLPGGVILFLGWWLAYHAPRPSALGEVKRSPSCGPSVLPQPVGSSY